MSEALAFNAVQQPEIWFEMRSPRIPESARQRDHFDLGDEDVAKVVVMRRVEEPDPEDDW